MKVINLKKIKIITLVIFLTITCVIFLSFFKFSHAKNRNNDDELVLEVAPEDILSPFIVFSPTSTYGLEYRIDENGNVVFRDRNGKLYTIDTNGNVYEIFENGEKKLITDPTLKNKILISALDSSKNNDYLKTLLNGNTSSFLKNIDANKLSDKDKRILSPLIEETLKGERETLNKAYNDLLKSAGLSSISSDELLHLLEKNNINDEDFLKLINEKGVKGAIDYLKNKNTTEENNIPLSTIKKKNSKNNDEKKSFVLSLPTKASNTSISQSKTNKGEENFSHPSFSSSEETLALLRETSASSYDSQNSQNAKRNFLKSNSNSESTKINEYSIMKGTIIPLTLITGINTDLPGTILAQVRCNIYDSLTGKNLLIEKGEKLTGYYNSSISYAQNRVQVVYDSLIKNDGTVIPLSDVIGIDEDGKSGYTGSLNRHILGLAAGSGASLLLNVGTSALSDITDSNIANSLINGLTKTTNSVASSFIEKELDRQPTITIEKGQKVNAFVNSTIQMFSDVL